MAKLLPSLALPGCPSQLGRLLDRQAIWIATVVMNIIYERNGQFVTYRQEVEYGRVESTLAVVVRKAISSSLNRQHNPKRRGLFSLQAMLAYVFASPLEFDTISRIAFYSLIFCLVSNVRFNVVEGRCLTLAAVITLLSSCIFRQHSTELPPLQAVAHVDLNRYLGLWYEVGRYPNSFQKGCLGGIAMYTARPDGKIDVLNSCRDEQDGSLRQAEGRAWVVDNTSNARLKVSFFWPFRGDAL